MDHGQWLYINLVLYEKWGGVKNETEYLKQYYKFANVSGNEVYSSRRQNVFNKWRSNLRDIPGK